MLCNNEIFLKTSLKGFSASKCEVGNWIFSKSWGIFWEFLNFLRIFGEFFGNSLWNSLGIVNDRLLSPA